MAQVQPVSTLNGGITEKNGNELTLEESSIAHIQNGVLLHGTPTKDLNGASTSLETAEELQLSPGDLRRRSTRASALKAQEKIKLKDDIVQGPQKRLGEEEESVAEDGTVPKKRRLETGEGFDQTCFRFGLRANDEGEVYAMTDESENSSIHDSEMEIVRYHYEKMLNREPDEETIRQRLKMRKDAENALREEEAKLAVLRKMRDSQGRAINKLAAETKAADLAEAAAANAYKPVLANPSKGGAVNNGKAATALANKQVLAGLANLTQTQQLDLLQKLSVSSQAAKHAYQLAKKNPAQTTQLFAQLIALNNAHQMMQKQKETETTDRGHQQQQQQSQAQITQTKVTSHQQTPAQRATAARLAFRAQADKQLMTIPTHKVQPHDITFLPNPNASAFLALHGLDQVVQHVLKDRSHEKPYSGPAYECEECKTDCAPTWKAIGSNPKELHLYCETCVRSAQKRKNRADQTNLLKRAFQKISAQEKEFEKKIADGSLEAFVETTVSKPTSSVPVATSSTATVISTPLPPHRLSNLPSSSGTSTPTLAHKTSTPLSSTPKTSSSASKKTMQQQQMLAMQQMMSQSLRNNPAAMAQMMQMYQMAQAAQAAQVQQAVAQGGVNTAALNLLMQSMAQQQAAHAISAQAQAQQQQQQQARAAQAKKEAAAAAAAQQQQQQQQHNQAMMMALLAQTKQMTPQMMQSLSNLTPAQQKAFYDMLQKAVKK